MITRQYRYKGRYLINTTSISLKYNILIFENLWWKISNNIYILWDTSTSKFKRNNKLFLLFICTSNLKTLQLHSSLYSSSIIACAWKSAVIRIFLATLVYNLLFRCARFLSCNRVKIRTSFTCSEVTDSSTKT